MDETTDEYELKTTMSPGPSRQGKLNKIKAPSILATKKNIRRSTICNKLRPSLKPPNVIEIFSSTTETSSFKSLSTDSEKAQCPQAKENKVIEISDDEIIEATKSSISGDKNSDRESFPFKEVKQENEDDIVIAGTDDDEEEDVQKKAVQEINPKKTQELLSQSKIASIENWINNIPSYKHMNEALDNANIVDHKGNQDNGPQGCKINKVKRNLGGFKQERKHIGNNVELINSTVLTDKTFIPFDKWIHKTSKDENCPKPLKTAPKLSDSKDSETEKVLSGNIRSIKISGQGNFSNIKSKLNEKQNKRVVLDLENKQTEKAMISPRKIQSTNISNDSNLRTPVSGVKLSANLLTTTSKEKMKDANNEEFVTPAKQVADNYDYAVQLLDELYGTSWHKNRNKVLSQSKSALKPQIHKLKEVKTVAVTEPRRPNNVHNKIKEPRTEKKSKPKETNVYRNPYLDSEREKSRNLLKSLQQERLLTKLQSPFFSKPTYADDESSSTPNSEYDQPKLKRTVLFPSSKQGVDTRPKKVSSTAKQTPRMKKFIKDSSSSSSDSESTKSSTHSPPKLSVKTPSKKCADDITNQLGNIALTDSVPSDKKVCVPQKVIPPVNKVKQLSFLASLSKNAPLEECDPSTLIFKNRFMQNREALCKKLFHTFNDRIFENCFPPDMQLEWNARLTNTAGVCVCMKKTHRDRSITRYAKLQLSTKILDSPDRLRDTLVHELCHAATFIVNGVSDGHGQIWKAWAAKAMRTFPELPPIRRCHDYAINYKYTYKCTKCSYSFGRHSKSLNLMTKACKMCLGRFDVFLNKTEKGEKKIVPCTPKKEATGFALFVKENYALHKSPSLSHADLMKFLGRKYQEKKDTDK